MSRVQAGRAGLGWEEAPRFWAKAKGEERKEKKEQIKRKEGDCGGRGLKDRGRMLQDQGHVSVPTRKLDNLRGRGQLQDQLDNM